MSIKAILFDFDGVILDSLNVKTEAFYHMYLPYGKEIAEKAANHHLAHGGISRFEKFKHYHKEFLQIDLNEAQINEMASEFSDRVLQGVINSPEVNGIRKFLENHYTQYKMWVITGTPTPEIKLIADKTNLSKYFVELYGSPEKKDFWTEKIIRETQLLPNEVLFVGDATTDYDAAKKTKVHFVLREHPENLAFFEDKQVVRITDFVNFETIIKQFK